jgi:hypothetical protein
LVSAGLTRRSCSMVDSVPLDGVDEQKLPKPCVG